MALLLIGYLLFLGPVASSGKTPEVVVNSKTHIISAAYKVYGRPELKFWVAKTIVRNPHDVPITGVEISYRIRDFTDWSTPSKYDEIPPGGAIVDLYYPVLPDRVAKLTSPVPTKLEVKISYEIGGQRKEILRVKQIDVLGIHDMVYPGIPPEEALPTFHDVFSNAPLLAAWVTPTDPVVREFSDLGNKIAGGAGAALSDQDAIRSMEGIWKAMLHIGVTYKTEPEGYWTGKHAQYVKFPRDVILDREGTCIDLSLAFISLVASQGLTDTYLFLVPGHAFPAVRLPESGSIIPVETTVLNQGASFREAIMVAVQNWQQKFSKGPYIVVPIKMWQAAGITPPELPPLPPDILERKGIKQELTRYIQALGGELKPFSNQFFRISYPAAWTADSGTDDEGNYVIWENQEGSMGLYVSWTQFPGSLQEYVAYIESLYPNLVRESAQQGSIGACPALIATYSWVDDEGIGWRSTELYVACNNAATHVALIAKQHHWGDGTAQAVWERVLKTFIPVFAFGG